MPRSQRSPFVFYAGLLVGGLALLLLVQLRHRDSPKSAGLHPALAANGQRATPLPLGGAGAAASVTAYGQFTVAPEAPVNLNRLPPAPRHDYSAGAEGKDRIESNLTDEEYQAAIQRALALPPDRSLSPGVGTLATGPTLGTNFNGLDIADCCGGGGWSWPPDPDIAVGPNHILVAVNSAFAIFNKSGVKQGSTINAYSFWSGVSNCGTGTGGSLYDPFVAYDPGADRFIVGFDATSRTSQGAASDQSYLCIAVSQTSNPTGAWNRYSIQANVGRTSDWLDYPHMGVWYNAIYTTGNYFGFSSNAFTTARVYAFDKSAMYTNGTVGVHYVDNPKDFYGNSTFTLQPAKASYTYPSSGPAYFLNNDCLYFTTPCDASELNVYTMTVDFVGAGTSFGLIGHPSIATYGFPISAPQSGSANMVQANDERLLDAQWHTNGTIYTTHTMSCNPGSGTVDCVRWYQVGNLGGTPSLLQQGTIFGNGEYRFFPDLAVDSAGNMAIAYSYSTSSSFIGIRSTGRLFNDSVNTTAGDSTFQLGGSVYANSFESSPPYRWGDYTGLVVDPADPCEMWYVGEYAKTGVGNVNWGTRIGQLSFSACAQLTLVVNPVSVMENAINPAATGTVTRSSANISGPLTVNISSSLPLTVTVPATVTIPSSQTSTTFPVSVVNDGVPGPTFLNATITVTATNYLNGTAPITVLDAETVKRSFLPLARR